MPDYATSFSEIDGDADLAIHPASASHAFRADQRCAPPQAEQDIRQITSGRFVKVVLSASIPV